MTTLNGIFLELFINILVNYNLITYNKWFIYISVY